MMLNIYNFIALAVIISQAYSFRLLSNIRITSTLQMSSTSFLESSVFDPIKVPVSDYVSIWTPLFASAKETGLAPDFLLHWGHGIAMGTVLLFMGGIGTFLGWQIRQGNGDAEYFFTLGKTAREQHPLIMGLATFFFFLGGQGGLVLLATQGQPILESPHAITAVLGFSLLLVQALLPVLFGKENGSNFRTLHAILGSSTMVALVVHGFNGYILGTSF